ncbi:hypothetical protein ACREYJ_06035 [Pseudomonas kribbensis]|uniref:hypothetical protein n=1 Tax=Pseudomonas kribbensis TaxID=1628086 RepID=UPI003D77DBBD
MADYGLSVSNIYGAVVISSSYKVMVFSERGSFRIQSRYSDKEGYGSVTFAKPVYTQEAPQVFLRHVSGVHASLGLFITMLGGPGNWTGFLITSAVRVGNTLQNYLIEYVVCKYSDQPSRQPYGMNIYDAQGQVVFSSDDKVVRYTKFAKNWTLVVGNQVDTYKSNLIIDADDFVCVSSIDRGLNWFADGAGYVGISLLNNNALTLEITAQRSGGGYWYYQGTNGTCFGVPVCKFPLSRYYN